MAEEITYIPYGQNEISQQDLMTNLANGLPSFMQQYKWLQKPKNQEKFLKAYDDITKNLTGATDSSGRWIINVNMECHLRIKKYMNMLLIIFNSRCLR